MISGDKLPGSVTNTMPMPTSRISGTQVSEEVLVFTRFPTECFVEDLPCTCPTKDGSITGLCRTIGKPSQQASLDIISWGAEKYYRRDSYTLFLTVRPMNTLSITLLPSYSTNFQELQYVGERDMNGDPRYIFGTIDQKVLSMSIRINFNITPDLTIQYWGQPFTASGDYSDYKMITDPKADRFQDRYHIYTDDQITLVGR